MTDWEIHVLQAIYRLEQYEPSTIRTAAAIAAKAAEIATEAAFQKLSPLVYPGMPRGEIEWSSKR